MVLLIVFDFLTWLIGGLMMIQQIFFMILSVIAKPLVFPEAPLDKRYAVLISARNEERVISGIIGSIRANSYPQDLIDIYVVADNCTDGTAQVVRAAGENVIERFNTEQVGKGFAMTYLFNWLLDTGRASRYDAFFEFDADSLVDKDYFVEMHKAFCSGFDIVTSYRNSRNLSDNWISAGSALWFIRECRMTHSSHMFLHSSSTVGGTGFMFSRAVMERNGGWKFHLITEDIEFTVDSIIHGDRIGYCATACLYDEQPVSFRQSWRQRLRWSKGFLQVFRYYGLDLLRHGVVDRDLSAFDLTLINFPFAVLTLVRIALGMIFVLVGFVPLSTQLATLQLIGMSIVGSLFFAMIVAAFTCILERDRIVATDKELVAYVLSFPVFMLSNVIISYQAIFSRPQWKPIEHRGGGALEEELTEGGAAPKGLLATA